MLTYTHTHTHTHAHIDILAGKQTLKEMALEWFKYRTKNRKLNRKGIRKQYDPIGMERKAADETKIKVCVCVFVCVCMCVYVCVCVYVSMYVFASGMFFQIVLLLYIYISL